MIVDLHEIGALTPKSWFSGHIMSSLRDLNGYLHNSIIISSLRDYR